MARPGVRPFRRFVEDGRRGRRRARRGGGGCPPLRGRRALYGIALLEDEARLDPALAEFRACLADRPSSGLLGQVGPEMAAAFAKAHRAVPKPLEPYVPKSARG